MPWLSKWNLMLLAILMQTDPSKERRLAIFDLNPCTGNGLPRKTSDTFDAVQIDAYMIDCTY
jgi:hypothetical protein